MKQYKGTSNELLNKLKEPLFLKSSTDFLEIVIEGSIDEVDCPVLVAMLKTNQMLHSLAFCECNIAVAALVEILETSHVLQCLKIVRNNLDADSVKVFTAELTKNRTLIDLTIQENKLGVGGAAAFAAVFSMNQTLQYIDLASNGFGVDGAKAFARVFTVNKTVQYVDFGWNNISSEGAKAFATALKANSIVRFLSLEYNFIMADGANAFAAVLLINQTLQCLNLEFNHIGDSGAKALAAALKKNSGLRILNIKNNHISVDGVKDIIEALKMNQTLEYINLTKNHIDDSVIQTLAELLEINQTLQRIDLPFLDIRESDTNTVTITNALKYNYSLTELWGIYFYDKNSYLERNQKIQNSFSCLNVDAAPLDGTTLLVAIDEIEALIPDLLIEKDKVPSNIIEQYHALCGLAQAHSLYPPLALFLLQEPFHLSDTQTLAQIACRDILMTMDNPIEEKVRDSRYRWLIEAAYHTQIVDPVLAQQAWKLGLVGLQNLSQSVSPSSMYEVVLETLIGTNKVLAYSEIIEMGRVACVDCLDHSAEYNYLSELVKYTSYDVFVVDYLLLSPAFQEIFKKKYPKIDSFRLIENIVLHPHADDPNRKVLKLVPSQIVVSNDLLSKYRAIHTNQNHIQSYDEFLKQTKQTLYEWIDNHVLQMVKDNLEEDTLQPPRATGEGLVHCVAGMGLFATKEARREEPLSHPHLFF